MRQKYYQMNINEESKEADIYIYGDITSWEWDESDVSSFTLSKELQSLPEDIQVINVYINSYGGEVAEGFYDNLILSGTKIMGNALFKRKG